MGQIMKWKQTLTQSSIGPSIRCPSVRGCQSACFQWPGVAFASNSIFWEACTLRFNSEQHNMNIVLTLICLMLSKPLNYLGLPTCQWRFNENSKCILSIMLLIVATQFATTIIMIEHTFSSEHLYISRHSSTAMASNPRSHRRPCTNK